MRTMVRRLLGSTWKRGHGVGMHIADDAVRLAVVELRQPQLVALAERPLPAGAVVRRAPRLAPGLTDAVAGLNTDLGLPKTVALTVAVDCAVDLAPGATPAAGATRVVVLDGRQVGGAELDTRHLSQIQTTVGSVLRVERIEAAALGLARLAQAPDAADEQLIVHNAEWATTTVAFVGGHSLEARLDPRSSSPLGLRQGETPSGLNEAGPLGRLATPEWAANSPFGEHLHRFAVAAGAALAPGSTLDGDFLAGRARSGPAVSEEPAGWVVERVADSWWSEPDTRAGANQ